MHDVAVDPAGQGASRMLLVRKARGEVNHKGGQVFKPYRVDDQCIVSWLRGDNSDDVRKYCIEAVRFFDEELSKLP